jgi:hypothetical protein
MPRTEGRCDEPTWAPSVTILPVGLSLRKPTEHARATCRMDGAFAIFRRTGPSVSVKTMPHKDLREMPLTKLRNWPAIQVDG